MAPPMFAGSDAPGGLSRQQRVVKRALDLILAFTLLMLLAPAIAAIALLVWLEARGPILFAQCRVGEGGRLFTMYKFRTMIAEAEQLQEMVTQRDEQGAMIHKRVDDPRITPLGRPLRRSSLDELPQLFNVLRGDMSLVGPRPELPWLVEQYEPWQYQRLAVPQGITGLWQINGRASRPMHLSSDVDIHYLTNYSLWLDLVILLKTPLAVLRGDGAY